MREGSACNEGDDAAVTSLSIGIGGNLAVIDALRVVGRRCMSEVVSSPARCATMESRESDRPCVASLPPRTYSDV